MNKTILKTKTFLEAVGNPVPLSDYQISEKKQDMGLVISVLSPEDFLQEANDDKAWEVSSSQSGDFENALEKGIQESRNVLLVINSDPSGDLLAQLKENSARGLVTKSDKASVLDPQNTKIICLVSPEMLEQISYPYFESLFGPVISLN